MLRTKYQDERGQWKNANFGSNANLDLGSLKVFDKYPVTFSDKKVSRALTRTVDSARLDYIVEGRWDKEDKNFAKLKETFEFGRHEAILNLILNGCPSAKRIVEEYGAMLKAKVFVATAPMTVESVFPKGEIIPPELWYPAFIDAERNKNSEFVSETGCYRLQKREWLTRNWFGISTFIACAAIQMAKLLVNDSLSGPQFTMLQSQLVLSRESGYISEDEAKDYVEALKNTSSINARFDTDESTLLLAALAVRHHIKAYADPTDRQRQMGIMVKAHGPFSIRLSTFFAYLHKLGWSAANVDPGVSAAAYPDSVLDEWVEKVPLPLQDVVSNAGGQIGGSGFTLEKDRQWLGEANLREARWRHLFYGNPALVNHSFVSRSSLHNSPLYHTRMMPVPWYLDKLWSLSDRFADYNSNFSSVLKRAIDYADREAATWESEVTSCKSSLEKYGASKTNPPLGWYLELVATGDHFMTGAVARVYNDTVCGSRALVSVVESLTSDPLFEKNDRRFYFNWLLFSGCNVFKMNVVHDESSFINVVSEMGKLFGKYAGNAITARYSDIDLSELPGRPSKDQSPDEVIGKLDQADYERTVAILNTSDNARLRRELATDVDEWDFSKDNYSYEKDHYFTAVAVNKPEDLKSAKGQVAVLPKKGLYEDIRLPVAQTALWWLEKPRCRAWTNLSIDFVEEF